MKKLFGVLALALAGTACQPQAPITQVALANAVPTARPVAAKSVRPTGAQPGTQLPPTRRELLVRYDLTPLLGLTQASGGKLQPHLQNGFFGPLHRRIEVVFTDVRRDANQPNLYYLSGKNRYKGVVTPFTGTLTLTKVLDQPRHTKQELANFEYDVAPNEPYAYTAFGDFELNEDPAYQHAGSFRGQAALDWGIDQGTVIQYSRTLTTLTQGGGIKFEGGWFEYGSPSIKSVVWVEDIFSFGSGQHILSNFLIGDRDPSFNPKYAKLGWNTYWTNDEWWVNSPKPSI